MEKIIEKYLNLDVKNVGGSTLRQMIEAAFLSLYAVTARPSHEGGVMQNGQDGGSDLKRGARFSWRL